MVADRRGRHGLGFGPAVAPSEGCLEAETAETAAAMPAAGMRTTSCAAALNAATPAVSAAAGQEKDDEKDAVFARLWQPSRQMRFAGYLPPG